MEAGGWMFNGLGSKGSLYAPGMARRLASWMLDGQEPEGHFDIRRFMENRA
jgi:glycine/D-amino acid oxidase-like deaminating enzyme